MDTNADLLQGEADRIVKHLKDSGVDNLPFESMVNLLNVRIKIHQVRQLERIGDLLQEIDISIHRMD